MKYFLKTTAYMLIAGTLSLGTGVFVHARTAGTVQGDALAFAFPSIKISLEKNISTDRQNALKNRDDRNAILLANDSASTSLSAISASSTEDLITGLSLSLSNLENIESRIDARAALAAGQGDNVDTVTYPLAEADRQLTIASTTLISIANDPGAVPIASSTDTIAQAIDSAKGSLEEALDALKIVLGN